MADKNGNKTGGRVKGTPNKDSLRALGIASGLNCDPIAFLCHVVNANVAELKEAPELDLRVSAAKELASYLHPKLKSIEISDPGRDEALRESLEAFLVKGK